MTKMNNQEVMKLIYKEVIRKEKLLQEQVDSYNTRIKNFLTDTKLLGEKLNESSTLFMLMQLQKQKSKKEENLLLILFEKNVLNAKINSNYARLRKDSLVEEVFATLNENRENNYNSFEYDYDPENDDIKNVIIY